MQDIRLMPIIILSTSNDISTDNRVHKVASVLQTLNYEVKWVGRELPGSLPLERTYATKRFKLWFNTGALFYANLNIRLFFYLLFTPCDVLLSNDLDTLLANRWVSRLRGKVLIYDTHEYFLGVPELQHRPHVKWVWKRIEKSIFPKLRFVFTVNESIATLYEKDYQKRPLVFRNISMPPAINAWKTREELGLPPDKFIFINQGSGINIDRGMEEALTAIATLNDAILLLVGKGDVIPALKQRVAQQKLAHKVIFIDTVPYDMLLQYTHASDCGLSLDKDNNVNYKYSLPNKLFDYIWCGIPVLCSRVIEVASIVKRYQIGHVAQDHSIPVLTAAMQIMMQSPKGAFQPGIERAQADLNWEREKNILLDFYGRLKKDL